MREYENYSREELIRQIEALKAENVRLAKITCSQTGLGGTQMGKTVRFKEKYAMRILESLPDMLTVLSDQGTLVDLVSSEETNHVGISAEELIGLNIRDILTDEAYAAVKGNLDLVVETNEGSTSHHDITLDGVTHNYENRIFPIDKGYTLCMCREVTEEVKAKEELMQANRRMAMAEEIASLNHWYYYENTKEFEAPKIFPLLAGTPYKESSRVPKEEFLSHVHPADREKLLSQLRGEQQQEPYVEYRLTVDGKTRYYHSRIIHTYQEGDSVIIEGYAQDMTYLVEQLHELEAVKYALNNAEEEIFACSPDGTLEFGNLKFIENSSVTGDVSTHKLYELGSTKVMPEEWDRLIKNIRNNDGHYKFTTRYQDPLRGIAALEIASYIVYDPVKEKEVVWFFSRDISVRLAHETRVKELNQLMDAILNNVPVCLFVKDPGNEFRYLYWNKTFAQDSGIPTAKALGRTDYDIFPDPRNADKFRQDDLSLLQRGETIQFEEQYTAVSGEVHTVFTSKILVPTENKLPLIIGVSWDITDIKNVERQLVAARIKAEEADKLKSAFLANMSHEIRTPLNAIMGFSKLIQEAENEEEREQYSDIIENNSELLLQLINDILDLSKIEAGTLEFKFKSMCLDDLCREQYEIHKDRVKSGVKLIFEQKQIGVYLECDYNRLAQVVTNLINNAIKFTTRGEIRFGFEQRGDKIDIFVSDTGIGIPERERKMIFDRFVKLNSHATGTGLGLSITKMIVERIGGTIGVESEVNVGTTFRFTIPVRPNIEKGPHDGTEEDNAARQPEDTAGTAEKNMAMIGSASETLSEKEACQDDRPTVLIAEDIDSNFMLMKAFIGKRFNLLWARNGREAVEMFERHRPQLIFMDIKMPLLDGYEATKAIRRLSTDVPILAITAFAFESDRQEAMEAGFNDYLTKPITNQMLDEKLSFYLSK